MAELGMIFKIRQPFPLPPPHPPIDVQAPVAMGGGGRGRGNGGKGGRFPREMMGEGEGIGRDVNATGGNVLARFQDSVPLMLQGGVLIQKRVLFHKRVLLF